MRLALLLAIGLALGGVVAISTVPTASACTSDPDALCIVINRLDECGSDLNHKTLVKRCVP